MRAQATKWKAECTGVDLAKRVQAAVNAEADEHRDEVRELKGISDADTSWRNRVLKAADNTPTREEQWAAMQKRYQEENSHIDKILKAIRTREENGNVWDVGPKVV